jgi:hypothetical protein
MSTDIPKESTDWRMELVTHLAEAIPSAYPGGPSHEKGTLLYASFNIKTSDNQRISFAAPNAVAMLLNLAMTAANSASEMRQHLEFKNGFDPDGACKVVPLEGTQATFAMFEQSLAAITFSFLALEAYCNYIISRNWKQPVKVKRKKGKMEELSHTDAERFLSTEEKIKSVLPKIFDVPTPAGKAIWQRFLELKKARDDSVHFKYADQYPVGKDIKTDGLFFQIWNTDPHEYPRTAKEVIEYFYQKTSQPDWLSRMPTLPKKK